jgi:hypothetical protein
VINVDGRQVFHLVFGSVQGHLQQHRRRPVHDQARLKLQHGMDFKRFDRTTTER